MCLTPYLPNVWLVVRSLWKWLSLIRHVSFATSRWFTRGHDWPPSDLFWPSFRHIAQGVWRFIARGYGMTGFPVIVAFWMQLINLSEDAILNSLICLKHLSWRGSETLPKLVPAGRGEPDTQVVQQLSVSGRMCREWIYVQTWEWPVFAAKNSNCKLLCNAFRLCPALSTIKVLNRRVPPQTIQDLYAIRAPKCCS